MPEMAVSDKFILSERYIRVDAPEDSGFAGFWCDVRQNISNGERRLLVERMDDIAATAQEQITDARTEAAQIGEQLTAGVDGPTQQRLIARLNEISDQMEAVTDDARVNRWALTAPYIRDWNAYTSTGDEDPVKVDPKAPDALDNLTRDMADWITNEVLQAYRSGKGVLNRSMPPGGSGLPMGGPKAASGKGTKRSSPPRQTSSSGLSASAFQA